MNVYVYAYGTFTVAITNIVAQHVLPQQRHQPAHDHRPMPTATTHALLLHLQHRKLPFQQPHALAVSRKHGRRGIAPLQTLQPRHAGRSRRHIPEHAQRHPPTIQRLVHQTPILRSERAASKLLQTEHLARCSLSVRRGSSPLAQPQRCQGAVGVELEAEADLVHTAIAIVRLVRLVRISCTSCISCTQGLRVEFHGGGVVPLGERRVALPFQGVDGGKAHQLAIAVTRERVSLRGSTRSSDGIRPYCSCVPGVVVGCRRYTHRLWKSGEK